MLDHATAAARPSHQKREPSDFTGQCLDGAHFADRRIYKVSFSKASLRRADLSRAEFVDCSFAGACLDEANLFRAVFENCDFSSASVMNANVQDAVFRATTVLGYGRNETMIRESKLHFDGARLDGSTFAGAKLVSARMHNVQAADVDFTNCDLRDSSFDGSHLKDVVFTNANLQDADFARCPEARDCLPPFAQLVAKLVHPISAAKLDGYIDSHKRWLQTNGQQGKRLNLQGYDLTGQKFENMDFSGTDLRGARLDKALFGSMKLVSADLRHASLLGTVFKHCDLRGAHLNPGALRRTLLNDTLVDPSQDPQNDDTGDGEQAFSAASPSLPQ